MAAPAALFRRPADRGDARTKVATAEPHELDAAVLGEHLDRLYRAALAMCGSPADAEDLVQEVCLRVLSKPRHVRGDDVGYLLGVLRNLFLSQCRTSARRRTTPVEPSTLARTPAGSRYDPELGMLAREVQREIAGLPAHYRDAVVAVDVFGLSYADAALALAVPEGTIMSRVSRGRTQVARCVGEPAAAACRP